MRCSCADSSTARCCMGRLGSKNQQYTITSLNIISVPIALMMSCLILSNKSASLIVVYAVGSRLPMNGNIDREMCVRVWRDWNLIRRINGMSFVWQKILFLFRISRFSKGKAEAPADWGTLHIRCDCSFFADQRGQNGSTLRKRNRKKWIARVCSIDPT